MDLFRHLQGPYYAEDMGGGGGGEGTPIASVGIEANYQVNADVAQAAQAIETLAAGADRIGQRFASVENSLKRVGKETGLSKQIEVMERFRGFHQNISASLGALNSLQGTIGQINASQRSLNGQLGAATEQYRQQTGLLTAQEGALKRLKNYLMPAYGPDQSSVDKATAGVRGVMSARMVGMWAILNQWNTAKDAIATMDMMNVSLIRITGSSTQAAEAMKTAGEVALAYGANLADVAGVMVELARTGMDLRSVEYLTAGLAETRLLLASSTGKLTDMRDMARYAVSISQQLQLGAGATVDVVRMMAELDIRTATNFDKLGQAMTRFAASGRVARLSVEEMLMAATALTEAGFSGEMAGTSLNTIFTRVDRSPKESAFMAKWGVSAAEIENGTMRINSSLDQLLQTYNNLLSVGKFTELKEFIELYAGTRQAPRLIALLDQLSLKTSSYKGIMKDALDTEGEAFRKRQEALEQMLDSVEVRRENLQNIVKTQLTTPFFIELHKGMLGGMAEMAYDLSGMLSSALKTAVGVIGLDLSPFTIDASKVEVALGRLLTLFQAYLMFKIPQATITGFSAVGATITNYMDKAGRLFDTLAMRKPLFDVVSDGVVQARGQLTEMKDIVNAMQTLTANYVTAQNDTMRLYQQNMKSVDMGAITPQMKKAFSFLPQYAPTREMTEPTSVMPYIDQGMLERERINIQTQIENNERMLEAHKTKLLSDSAAWQQEQKALKTQMLAEETRYSQQMGDLQAKQAAAAKIQVPGQAVRTTGYDAEIKKAEADHAASMAAMKTRYDALGVSIKGTDSALKGLAGSYKLADDSTRSIKDSTAALEAQLKVINTQTAKNIQAVEASDTTRRQQLQGLTASVEGLKEQAAVPINWGAMSVETLQGAGFASAADAQAFQQRLVAEYQKLADQISNVPVKSTIKVNGVPTIDRAAWDAELERIKNELTFLTATKLSQINSVTKIQLVASVDQVIEQWGSLKQRVEQALKSIKTPIAVKQELQLNVMPQINDALANLNALREKLQSADLSLIDRAQMTSTLQDASKQLKALEAQVTNSLNIIGARSQGVLGNIGARLGNLLTLTGRIVAAVSMIRMLWGIIDQQVTKILSKSQEISTWMAKIKAQEDMAEKVSASITEGESQLSGTVTNLVKLYDSLRGVIEAANQAGPQSKFTREQKAAIVTIEQRISDYDMNSLLNIFGNMLKKAAVAPEGQGRQSALDYVERVGTEYPAEMRTALAELANQLVKTPEDVDVLNKILAVLLGYDMDTGPVLETVHPNIKPIVDEFKATLVDWARSQPFSDLARQIEGTISSGKDTTVDNTMAGRLLEYFKYTTVGKAGEQSFEQATQALTSVADTFSDFIKNPDQGRTQAKEFSNLIQKLGTLNAPIDSDAIRANRVLIEHFLAGLENVDAAVRAPLEDFVTQFQAMPATTQQLIIGALRDLKTVTMDNIRDLIRMMELMYQLSAQATADPNKLMGELIKNESALFNEFLQILRSNEEYVKIMGKSASPFESVINSAARSWNKWSPSGSVAGPGTRKDLADLLTNLVELEKSRQDKETVTKQKERLSKESILDMSTADIATDLEREQLALSELEVARQKLDMESLDAEGKRKKLTVEQNRELQNIIKGQERIRDAALRILNRLTDVNGMPLDTSKAGREMVIDVRQFLAGVLRDISETNKLRGTGPNREAADLLAMYRNLYEAMKDEIKMEFSMRKDAGGKIIDAIDRTNTKEYWQAMKEAAQQQYDNIAALRSLRPGERPSDLKYQSQLSKELRKAQVTINEAEIAIQRAEMEADMQALDWQANLYKWQDRVQAHQPTEGEKLSRQLRDASLEISRMLREVPLSVPKAQTLSEIRDNIIKEQVSRLTDGASTFWEKVFNEEIDDAVLKDTIQKFEEQVSQIPKDSEDFVAQVQKVYRNVTGGLADFAAMKWTDEQRTTVEQAILDGHTKAADTQLEAAIIGKENAEGIRDALSEKEAKAAPSEPIEPTFDPTRHETSLGAIKTEDRRLMEEARAPVIPSAATPPASEGEVGLDAESKDAIAKSSDAMAKSGDVMAMSGDIVAEAGDTVAASNATVVRSSDKVAESNAQLAASSEKLAAAMDGAAAAKPETAPKEISVTPSPATALSLSAIKQLDKQTAADSELRRALDAAAALPADGQAEAVEEMQRIEDLVSSILDSMPGLKGVTKYGAEKRVFVEAVLPSFAKAAQEFGYPLDWLMAQAGLESGFNLGTMKGGKNLFGMKANAAQIARGDYVEAMDNGKLAKFRKYDSIAEGVVDALKNAIITNLERGLKMMDLSPDIWKTGKLTTEQWARAMHLSPYAEDTKYDSKLLQVYKANDLQKLRALQDTAPLELFNDAAMSAVSSLGDLGAAAKEAAAALPSDSDVGLSRQNIEALQSSGGVISDTKPPIVSQEEISAVLEQAKQMTDMLRVAQEQSTLLPEQATSAISSVVDQLKALGNKIVSEGGGTDYKPTLELINKSIEELTRAWESTNAKELATLERLYSAYIDQADKGYIRDMLIWMQNREWSLNGVNPVGPATSMATEARTGKLEALAPILRQLVSRGLPASEAVNRMIQAADIQNEYLAMIAANTENIKGASSGGTIAPTLSDIANRAMELQSSREGMIKQIEAQIKAAIPSNIKLDDALLAQIHQGAANLVDQMAQAELEGMKQANEQYMQEMKGWWDEGFNIGFENGWDWQAMKKAILKRVASGISDIFSGVFSQMFHDMSAKIMKGTNAGGLLSGMFNAMSGNKTLTDMDKLYKAQQPSDTSIKDLASQLTGTDSILNSTTLQESSRRGTYQGAYDGIKAGMSGMSLSGESSSKSSFGSIDLGDLKSGLEGLLYGTGSDKFDEYMQSGMYNLGTYFDAQSNSLRNQLPDFSSFMQPFTDGINDFGDNWARVMTNAVNDMSDAGNEFAATAKKYGYTLQNTMSDTMQGITNAADSIGSVQQPATAGIGQKFSSTLGSLLGGIMNSLVGFALGALFNHWFGDDPAEKIAEAQKEAQKDRVTASGYNWTYREPETATSYGAGDYNPPITQESVKIIKFSSSFTITTDAAQAMIANRRELERVCEEILTQYLRTMSKTIGAQV